MSDQYERIRSLSFPVLCSVLGIDFNAYRSRKAGSEHYGPCPIPPHTPKGNHMSFSYNADGRYFCFSCLAKGKGGLDFVKATKGISFQQAVELLQSGLGGIPQNAGATRATNAKANAQSGADTATSQVLKPYSGSYEKFKVECEWLQQRIPSKEILERYGVFCYDNPKRKSAYSGRVMLPVKDAAGQLMGYLGRALPPSNPECPPPDYAKYLFPVGLPKSRFLFGAHELSQLGTLPLRVCYLVESGFAVMRLAMLGVPAVAAYGWSVSDDQVDILAQLAKGVYYLPDRNKVQESAGVIQKLARRLWVKAPTLPDGVDDAEYLTIQQVQAL